MTTLLPSFLDESSKFLQVTRKTIKAEVSLNFVKIPSPTSVLAALEDLKKKMNSLVTTSAPLFLIGLPHSCR